MKGKIVKALSLIITFTVVFTSLYLPDLIIKGQDSQQLDKVVKTDKTYYSNSIDAYSGELDLYRKLLLISGEWKRNVITTPLDTVIATKGEEGEEYPSYESNTDTIVAYSTDDGVVYNMGALYNADPLTRSLMSLSDQYNKEYGFSIIPSELIVEYSDDGKARVERWTYTDSVFEKYTFKVLVYSFYFDSGQNITYYWDEEENMCLGIYLEFNGYSMGYGWFERVAMLAEYEGLDEMIIDILMDRWDKCQRVTEQELEAMELEPLYGAFTGELDNSLVYRIYNDSMTYNNSGVPEYIYFIIRQTDTTAEIYFTKEAAKTESGTE